MKVTPDHYAMLRGGIMQVLGCSPNAAAAYRAKGLSYMRFRWDVLHAAGVNLYHYGYTDVHIDTALRRIMREYGVEQW